MGILATADSYSTQAAADGTSKISPVVTPTYSDSGVAPTKSALPYSTPAEKAAYYSERQASKTSTPSTSGTTYPVTIGGGDQPVSEVGPVKWPEGGCPAGTKRASNGECIPIGTNVGGDQNTGPPVTGASPPPGGCPAGTIWDSNALACVARPPPTSTETPLNGSILFNTNPMSVNKPVYNINDLYTDPYSSEQSNAPNIGAGDMATALPANYAPGVASGLLMGNGPTTINSGGVASGATDGYAAHTQNLDPNSLAGARMQALLDQDSPLAQRAKQEGMLTAAQRGLQNSSIAAGTSFGALTDRISPLALAESEALTQQQLANQAAINTASQFSAGLKSQLEQLNAQIKSQEAISGAQLTSDERKLAAQLQSQESMFAAEQANQMTQFNANWANQATTLAAEMDLQSQQFNIGQQNAINSLVMQMNADLNKQYLSGTQAMDLATIQGQFQQLISQNQVAAELFNSGMSAIGQAMANHEIPPSQIASYVAVQQDLIASGLQLMADINNLNFEVTNTDLESNAPDSITNPFSGDTSNIGSPRQQLLDRGWSADVLDSLTPEQISQLISAYGPSALGPGK